MWTLGWNTAVAAGSAFCRAATDTTWLLLLIVLVSLLSTATTLLCVFLFSPFSTMTCGCAASIPTAATSPLMQGGYRATKRNLKYLKRYKAGKSIGFTMRSSLKAKGLIPRANGTYRVSKKYQTKTRRNVRRKQHGGHGSCWGH
jgi:hypothetical protein